MSNNIVCWVDGVDMIFSKGGLKKSSKLMKVFYICIILNVRDFRNLILEQFLKRNFKKFLKCTQYNTQYNINII